MRTALLIAAAVLLWISPAGAHPKIFVNGLWGQHPVTYRQAVKRMPFHILLPADWKPRDCKYWTQWIRKEPRMTPMPLPIPTVNWRAVQTDLPARPALAIQRKDDQTSLIIETLYIQSRSLDDNLQGMNWIIGNGYFIKDEPMGVERSDHIGSTASEILTTSPDMDEAYELGDSLR